MDATIPPDVLPDVLGPGLRVVFCGSAAGAASARVGAYYAGPGNRFWPTLYRVGLTPHLLAPAEFRTLLRYRIGLTDICKTESGADAGLSGKADDAAALAAKSAPPARRARVQRQACRPRLSRRRDHRLWGAAETHRRDPNPRAAVDLGRGAALVGRGVLAQSCASRTRGMTERAMAIGSETIRRLNEERQRIPLTDERAAELPIELGQLHAAVEAARPDHDFDRLPASFEQALHALRTTGNAGGEANADTVAAPDAGTSAAGTAARSHP